MALVRSLGTSSFRDAMVAAHDMATAKASGPSIVGFGVAQLMDGEGQTMLLVPFANLITDIGDMYYATRAIAAVSPAAAADATKLTGMQIGSSSTNAAAKNGSGAALGAILAGQAFDASYPQTSNLGAGLGVNAVYKTTYAAGTGTGSVVEATLTNTATLGTASIASNTIARVTFSTITKSASDSLAITWNNKFLGS